MTERERTIIHQKIFKVSHMQSAINKGYEGYIHEDPYQGLVYKAGLPRHEIFIPDGSTVVVATENKIRKNLLRYLLESTSRHINLQFLSGEDEVCSDAPDVIAMGKAKKTSANYALGIDSLSMIPGKGFVKKPKTLGEISDNFRHILRFAQTNSLPQAYYYLNSASVLRDGNKEYIGKSAVIIGLKLNRASYLATRQGADEYCSIADTFQDKKVMQNYAESLLNIGGGIALPVLLQMKAVESVNGITLCKSEESRRTFLSAYRVAVAGGGDSVYTSLFGNQAREAINNWKWVKDRVSILLSTTTPALQ